MEPDLRSILRSLPRPPQPDPRTRRRPGPPFFVLSPVNGLWLSLRLSPSPRPGGLASQPQLSGQLQQGVVIRGVRQPVTNRPFARNRKVEPQGAQRQHASRRGAPSEQAHSVCGSAGPGSASAVAGGQHVDHRRLVQFPATVAADGFFQQQFGLSSPDPARRAPAHPAHVVHACCPTCQRALMVVTISPACLSGLRTPSPERRRGAPSHPQLVQLPLSTGQLIDARYQTSLICPVWRGSGQDGLFSNCSSISSSALADPGNGGETKRLSWSLNSTGNSATMYAAKGVEITGFGGQQYGELRPPQPGDR